MSNDKGGSVNSGPIFPMLDSVADKEQRTGERKMNGLEHYKKKEHVSISSLTSFCRCPRLFFYSAGCRLQPRTEQIWFPYGTAVHAAMPFVVRGDIDAAMMAFISSWGLNDQMGDDKRNSARALVLLTNAIEVHKEKLYEVLPRPEGRYELDDEVSMDEIPFALDIGLELPFVGKIDAVGRHRDSGGLYAVEYKTSSRLGSSFLRAFDSNPQTFGYAMVLQMLMDEKVDGTIIVALGVAKTKAEVLMHPVSVGEQQMEEFLTWAVRQTELMLECDKKGEWPKDCSACHPYSQFGSHGFTCDYADLCRVDDWTSIMEMFQVKEYDLFSSVKKESVG